MNGIRQGAIPLLVNLSNGIIEVAALSDATHALVHVELGEQLANVETQFLNDLGEVYIGVVIQVGTYKCNYADLTTAGRGNRRIAQLCGLALLSEQPLIEYAAQVPTYDLDRLYGKYRIDAARTNKACHLARDVLDGTAQLPDWPVSKITSAHHTHVRAIEAVRAGGRDKLIPIALALSILMHTDDTTQAFAAGLIIWACAADSTLVLNLLRSEGAQRAKNIDEWGAWAKHSTQEYKLHHHYDQTPLEQAFELSVLINRGTGAVDWEAERAHRVRPNVVPIHGSIVHKEALAIFHAARARGYFYKRQSWNQFWQQRWASVPTGSVHSQYMADKKYMTRERETRTKHYTATSMPDVTMSYFSDRLPEIVAWPSIKYEWGKQRAIYGTDLTSYLLTDFAMPKAEDVLADLFPVGVKANEKYVTQRIRLAGAAGIAMCFDYEDFNSQHSLESMEAVLSAFNEVYGAYMSPEQRQAMDWVQQSVLRQRVEGPDPYSTAGTLLSGWRLTTFCNTLLNYIYLKECGALEHVHDSVHNGDDVLAYAYSVHDARMMLVKAHAAGIRAQPAKCAIAGLEEFLRVDRAATKPTGAQYLTRACATLVHARAESGVPEAVTTQVQAHLTRLDETEARGADPGTISALRDNMFRIVAKSFETDEDTLRLLLTTHEVHGGLSTDKGLIPKYALIEERATAAAQLDNPHGKLPGVRSYARYLQGLFSVPDKRMGKVIEAIARALSDMVSYERRRLDAVRISDVNQARVDQWLAGTCRDEMSIKALIGRARLARLPVGAALTNAKMQMAAIRISKSLDPFRTMKIIF